ncbi:MAG: hypothetical protein WAL25_13270 [Acidimicrobiia bacterium]
MTALTPSQGVREATDKPAAAHVLAGLLALLAVGAIQGGVAMVANPTGPLGMSLDYLERSPVDDYFWPGVFLLSVAVASILAVVGIEFEWQWNWAEPIERAIGHRWPWLASLAVGGLLLGFEIIELFVVPFHPVMHPLLIAVAVVIIALSLAPSTRDYLKSR